MKYYLNITLQPTMTELDEVLRTQIMGLEFTMKKHFDIQHLSIVGVLKEGTTIGYNAYVVLIPTDEPNSIK